MVWNSRSATRTIRLLDEGEDDAEQQDLLLVLPRYPEAGHDDEEDEQVVDRQSLLGDVAGEVLRAHLGAAEGEHHHPEQKRQPHIEAGPECRLLQRRNVNLADVEEVVEGEDRGDRQGPLQGGYGHRLGSRSVGVLCLREDEPGAELAECGCHLGVPRSPASPSVNSTIGKGLSSRQVPDAVTPADPRPAPGS